MDNSYQMALTFNSQMETIANMCKQLEEKETCDMVKDEGHTGDTTTTTGYEQIILTFDNIKDYLDTQSKSFKRFVVFNYPDRFVIMRIIDNSDTKAIYRFMTAESTNDTAQLIQTDDSQKQYEKILELASKYLNSTFEKVQRIDNKITGPMFVDKVIPYGWFQRNTSTSPAFRKTGDPTKALKDILWAMVEKGAAEIVTGEKYGTGAKLYKINKSVGILGKVSENAHKGAAPAIDKLAAQKESELAHIAGLLPSLGILGCEELEINENVAVTYHDIRRYLNEQSKGSKKYGVVQDEEENCFRIVRQLDDSNLSIFYRSADNKLIGHKSGKVPNVTPTPAPSIAMTPDIDDLPERKDAHPGFQMGDDYMRASGQE